MATHHRTAPTADPGAVFRDRVRRLGRPDRRRSEAIRVRVTLARASRVGLRDRLARSTELRGPISV